MSEPFGPTMDLDTWKAKAMAGDAPTDVVLHKDLQAEIKTEGDRVSFTISTEAPDRDKDVIQAGGWELENFRKNPVVLWAHDYRSLPIGKAVSIERDGTTLRAVAEFVPKDTPIAGPMAEAVSSLLKGGFLNATSVGFRPLKHSFNDDRGGFDFEKTELLEFSVVPVPAHPDALQDAKSAGIDIKPIVDWSKGVCEANGMVFKGEPEAESVTKEVKTVVETESTITIKLSDELKALLEPVPDKKAADNYMRLDVDFDPGEMRLEMEVEPEPEAEVDTDALRDMIRNAVLAGVREKVNEVARDQVNALRGRVD